MDYLHCSIALGVDVLLLGLCYKDYSYFKKTCRTLARAPVLNLDSSLKNVLKEEGKLYCAIRGTVQPMSITLRSSMVPSIQGVLQVMKLNEHSVNRTFGGFWTEHNKNVHTSFNTVPFKIMNKDVGVEIIDALSADIIDMDLVYDNYEPSKLSFLDHLFGFFSGMRQKGFQTTEEILRDGSFITVIGELDGSDGNLKLQPSPTGPMILTTATKNTIIKRYQDLRSSALGKVIVTSAIAIILLGIISRKLYKKLKTHLEAKKLKDELEKIRLESRSRGRAEQEQLRDDQKCIVCWVNPKEVIVLPCAHICLCVDCSTKIKVDSKKCPFCRAAIEQLLPAFIV